MHDVGAGADDQAPVAPPDEALAAVREAYERYNDGLAATPFDRFVRFMNFGYDDVGGTDTGTDADLDDEGSRREGPSASARLVREVLGDEPLAGRVVVDVGCGRGGTLGLVRRAAPDAVVVGVDLVLSSVRVARRGRRPVPVLVADAQRLALRSASVDVVVNIESAVHYPNIAAFYCEVARCLRPGGALLYADLWLADAVDDYRAALGAAGLAIEHEHDITAEVLAARRRRAARERLVLDAGTSGERAARLVAAEGTPFFEAFASGRFRYRRLRLRRTGEPPGHPPAVPPAALAGAAGFTVRAMADAAAGPGGVAAGRSG